MSMITLIVEGGNAVSNVVPIRSEDTLPTLEDINNKILKRFLKLGKGEWASLGSTGKKLPGQTSGDIDIAIDINSLSKTFNIEKNEVGKKVFDLIDNVYPKMDKKYMKGLGIISIAYPIKGSNGNVQVDLMLQDDINFAKWIFFSPDFRKNESKWKGLYRTELLKAIGSAVSIQDMTVYWEDEFDGKFKGQFKKRGRYMLDPNKGYKKQLKSYIGKSGKLVKTGTVEMEELISKDPEFITKALLGADATIKDTISFESVWKAMHNKDFPWKKHLDEIVVYFKDLLEKKGLPIPSEIDKHKSSKILERNIFTSDTKEKGKLRKIKEIRNKK